MITESHRQMVEAQVELQKQLFERQDKRDRNAEAASARLQSAQAMPREQVIHQHITNTERPAQDIDTLLKSHLETTEQRMLRHMHTQFGQSGALISHLAGRVDNIAAALMRSRTSLPLRSSFRERRGQQDRLVPLELVQLRAPSTPPRRR